MSLQHNKLCNLIESYAAIVNISTNDIKEYAKAAIRDIFIQMPSRSVTYQNWPGYENYIREFFGNDSYEIAMKELFSDGWLTEGETRYEWKKMYPHVPRKKQLKEWADGFTYGNKNLSYLSTPNIVFGYHNGELKTSGSPRVNVSHFNIGIHTTDETLHTTYAGRIWPKQKIISFWGYPESKSKFHKIINDLNDIIYKYGIKIDYKWTIEIPDALYNYDVVSSENDKMKYNYDDAMESGNFESDFVPLSQYSPYLMAKIKDKKDKKLGSEKRYSIPDISKVHGAYKQGDIPQHVAHQLKYTSESLNENNAEREYGCLMLEINFPNWKEFIHSYIKDEDVYEIQSDEYGYEKEPHVTILYGFKYDDINKIKKILSKLKNKISIFIKDIDIFSTDKFDVVKFNVESKMLVKLNEIMVKNFDHVTTFRDYKPHMTLAYVKKGFGEKYIKKMNKLFILRSGEFKYSFSNGKNEYFSI